MKKTIILALVSVLGLAGCVSTGTAPKVIVPVSTAQSIASIVEPIVQGAVPLILNKNPQYAPALSVLGAAIPAALSSTTLDPVGIAQAISLLNDKAKLGLTPDVQALIANSISIAVTQYQTKFSVKVATATDPGIQLLLTSIATGLTNGVQTWQVTHKQ